MAEATTVAPEHERRQGCAHVLFAGGLGLRSGCTGHGPAGGSFTGVRTAHGRGAVALS